MSWSEDSILKVLDDCCRKSSFPKLDNGNFHMAASRMFLFRTAEEWALTLEVFGFSPRAEDPEIQVTSIGSRLINRPGQEDFINDYAWRQYMTNHPHDECRYVFPIEGGDWIDGEWVSPSAEEVVVRGEYVLLPSRSDYVARDIQLKEPERIMAYECCRYLAESRRNQVLCQPGELVANLPPELTLVLKVEEWCHPDLRRGELASGTECFQQIARVLASGDVSVYQPSVQPNTHWKNWPDEGPV